MIPSQERKTSAMEIIPSGVLDDDKARVDNAPENWESQSTNEKEFYAKESEEYLLTIITDNKESLEDHQNVSPEIKERKENISDSEEESIDSSSSEVESSENEASEDNDSESEWIDISDSEFTPRRKIISLSSNFGKVRKGIKRKMPVLRRRKRASHALKMKKKTAQVLSVPTRKAMTVIKPKELKRLNESKELETQGRIGKDLKSLYSKKDVSAQVISKVITQEPKK